MRSWDDIVALTRAMMNEQEPAVRWMREINLRYRGDYVIPFPKLQEEPQLPPLTPQLVGESIDQLGMRAAQVDPIMRFPAVNPDKARGKFSIDYASRRRRAVYACLKKSKWELQRSKVTRQLVAYNTTALIVVPNFERPEFRWEGPLLQVRDPLATFTEYVDPSTPRPPAYGAFVTRHSGEWMRRNYPNLKQENGGPITKNKVDAQWDLVEWIDQDQCVYGLLGPEWNMGEHITGQTWQQKDMSQIVAGPFPNMCEYPIIVNPRAVTLTGVASRIGNMLGMVDVMAKLQGLEILAQQKAIFPDTAAIGRANGSPSIVGGRWKDGSEGDINLLNDVEAIQVLNTSPPQSTPQTIDRMERNWRTSTGFSPMFGGESYGSLRTGRAIDAMTNMSVDPRIMEIHQVLAGWMPHINEAILSTWKMMWPGKKYTLFTDLRGDQSSVEFEPAVHVETCESVVEYPFPGADVTMTTQILGSLLGTRSISLSTMRELHPWVGDFDGEGELVMSEELTEAMMQAILTQISSGAMPLEVVSLIDEKVRKGTPLLQAVGEAQREIQERQATAAPPAAEGQLAAPEEMPGLAAGPGAMMQAPAPVPPPGPAPLIEPNPDVNAMRALFAQMGAA